VSVIWHEAECGGYTADLALWEELAGRAQGEILELGCGTGRVAIHLARRGHAVTGLDVEEGLVAAFAERATDLPAIAVAGDARHFELGREFGLVLAPMQLLQLLASEEDRLHCLQCVAAHLSTDGQAAFAIVEQLPAPVEGPPLLPDTREVDGWVYSSLPVDAVVDSEGIRVRRLRQTVSPAGDLSEEVNEVSLRALDAAALEHGAQRAGLRAAGRRTVPPTDAHVGSIVVLLEREA